MKCTNLTCIFAKFLAIISFFFHTHTLYFIFTRDKQTDTKHCTWMATTKATMIAITKHETHSYYVIILRMSTLVAFIEHDIRCFIIINQTRKKYKIKGIQTGKEEVKLSLFTDDMILYIENPKESAKKTIITNKCVQQGWRDKIDIQKSIVFLYASNKIF